MNEPVLLEESTIELTEYTGRAVALSDADHDYLLAERSRWISLGSMVENEVYWLDPGPHVGVIVLPSGRRIRSNPKVEVNNVFVMIGTLLDPRVKWFGEQTQFEVIDDVFDFFVTRFADLVEERLRQGLYRTYLDREENLLMVRGRIRIAEDIRRNHVLRHRTYCQFQEFTWDVPENQVIRQAVHVASALVRKDDLQRRLASLDSQLGEIDPTPLPLSVFDRFTYHRLNEDYEPIHQLAKLILQGVSVSEHFGEITFRSFMLDMNKLFEDYVSLCLSQRCQGGLRLRSQYPSHLDIDRKVAFKPDLVYLWQREPIGVADCKYKRIEDNRFLHHDLYQMLAYSTALNLPRGALIYPLGESPVDEQFIEVRNSGVQIRHFNVDLGVSMRELPLEMDRLSSELLGWLPAWPEVAISA